MKMTIEEQHIALMEFMGWEIAEHCRTKTGRKSSPPDFGKNPATGNWENLPPLTLDLCHEAEKKLNPSNLSFPGTKQTTWTKYVETLCKIVHEAGEGSVYHATKEQRCESILRTVGRWRE